MWGWIVLGLIGAIAAYEIVAQNLQRRKVSKDDHTRLDLFRKLLNKETPPDEIV